MYSWEYITSKRKTIIIRFSQGFHGIDCRNSRGLKEEDTEVSVFWFPIKFFFFFCQSAKSSSFTIAPEIPLSLFLIHSFFFI